MTRSLEERLNHILPRITSRDFLDSKGLGNEIGFWIFDYPPSVSWKCGISSPARFCLP
jgi:hypothetical protein